MRKLQNTFIPCQAHSEVKENKNMKCTDKKGKHDNDPWIVLHHSDSQPVVLVFQKGTSADDGVIERL